jgi:flagellar motor switch protein FliN/FliY
MTAPHPLSTDETDLAVVAAAAAAGVLPAPEELDVALPLPGTPQLAAEFAGAVLTEIEGGTQGRLGVLVGEDLVTALSQSPLGGLDLAAALQPTLDAVAGALEMRAGVAREVDPALVVSDLGDAVTAVPLVGSGPVAVVLVPDALLRLVARRGPGAGDAASQPAGVPAFGSQLGSQTLGGQLGGQAPVGQMLGGQTPVGQTLGGPAPTATLGGTLGGTTLGSSLGSPMGGTPSGRRRGIELLHGVDMEVTVEIGRTRMTVRELLELSPGAVLELDRAAGSPADLLVNGRLIARGEVVVVDEDFGLRVTEIVTDTAGV